MLLNTVQSRGQAPMTAIPCDQMSAVPRLRRESEWIGNYRVLAGQH